jgi:hypothetical protein
MKTKTNSIVLSCILFVFINFSAFSQTLFGPDDFAVDNILHGTTGNTTQWFAPSYNTPIDHLSSGGCPGGAAGFSGNWLNYWGNFLRTPAIDCTGHDTVYLHFSLSNSFIASQSNNKIYFNMWVDGGYEQAFSNQTIFFDSLRNCVEYTVGYDLTPYIDLSGIFFYFNASCGYDNSNIFSFELDNISLAGKNGIHTNSDFYNENEEFDIYSYDNTIAIANPSYTNYIVNVYNLLGSLIFSEKQYGNAEFQLKPGMYIVQIQSKNKTISKKIILQ